MRWWNLFILCVLLLSACSNQDVLEPASDAPEAREPARNVASASGRLLPATRADLGFTAGGRIGWVISTGSQVNGGDELARLDAEALEGTLAQAQAGFEAAEAQLAQATEGATEAQLAAATGALTVAEANVSLAEAELDQTKSAAELNEEAAQAEVDRAQGLLDLAETEADSAATRFGEDSQEAAAAQANVTIAEAGLAAAETALAQAEDSSSLVAAAEARLQFAQGQREQAQANLDTITGGPTPAELDVLTAQVAQAEATVAAARAALDGATLVAPFAGTVAAVNFHPGEVILPGQPLLSVGDLDTLQVETTDLDEADAAQIEVGMAVTVTFDALPGYITGGQVVDVATKAAQGQGGTSFRLVVAPDTLPAALRWGMIAFVDIPLE